ncbi:hypothetical protein, partial [Klebsiella aerogenes]|uniref:hypothetical protein n=1 Tax=Klebsiella aerogenes TaxID=548 RepID=UPI0019540455
CIWSSIALAMGSGESGYHLMVLSTAGAASPGDVGLYLRASQQHSLAGVIMMGVDATHPALE